VHRRFGSVLGCDRTNFYQQESLQVWGQFEQSQPHLDSGAVNSEASTYKSQVEDEQHGWDRRPPGVTVCHQPGRGGDVAGCWFSDNCSLQATTTIDRRGGEKKRKQRRRASPARHASLPATLRRGTSHRSQSLFRTRPMLDRGRR
jgi:hypothetical protein